MLELFGPVLSTELAVAVVSVPAGLVLGRGIAQEVTRQREARARDRAAESARRELVAWISHDLRTPLGLLVVSAEIPTVCLVYAGHGCYSSPSRTPPWRCQSNRLSSANGVNRWFFSGSYGEALRTQGAAMVSADSARRGRGRCLTRVSPQ